MIVIIRKGGHLDVERHMGSFTSSVAIQKKTCLPDADELEGFIQVENV